MEEKKTPFFEPEGMKVIGCDQVFSEPENLGDNIWVLDNVMSKSFCDTVIKEFELRKDKQYQGVTGLGVNLEVKDSKDMLVNYLGGTTAKFIDHSIYDALHRGTGRVIQKLTDYPFVPGFHPDMLFHHDTGYQIQKTTPGGRYIWHIENAQSMKCYETGNAARTLTYIIYLNDINENIGGATGFLYQKTKVQPKAGRLVLFPPYWTHVHAGHPLMSGIKYIVTGWFFSEAHIT